MALATVISFDDPRKYPPLLRLSDGVKRPDVRKVMGRALTILLRKHFTKLDRTRKNKLGGRRTHFWGQVRRSVQQPTLIGGDGLRVDINHVGIALQYFGTAGLPGGVLRPVVADRTGQKSQTRGQKAQTTWRLTPGLPSWPLKADR